MELSSRKRALLLLVCLFLGSFLDLVTAHQHHSHSDFSPSNLHHHHCGGAHDHDHDHDHDHHHHHDHDHDHVHHHSKLPEELAEEEDMKLYGFGLPHHHHHFTASTELSGLGILLFSIFPLSFFYIIITFDFKLSTPVIST